MKRILVVEDYPEISQIYHDVLIPEGYRVSRALCGRDALDCLLHDAPDLVLLDLELPDMSGWDVFRMIRMSDEWHDIPVVVITGCGDAVNTAQGWRLGCTCYLQKPVDLNDLRTVVKRALRHDVVEAEVETV